MTWPSAVLNFSTMPHSAKLLSRNCTSTLAFKGRPAERRLTSANICAVSASTSGVKSCGTATFLLGLSSEQPDSRRASASAADAGGTLFEIFTLGIRERKRPPGSHPSPQQFSSEQSREANKRASALSTQGLGRGDRGTG